MKEVYADINSEYKEGMLYRTCIPLYVLDKTKPAGQIVSITDIKNDVVLFKFNDGHNDFYSVPYRFINIYIKPVTFQELFEETI